MILVTGASGNLGRQVVQHLVARGIPYVETVRSLDHTSTNSVVLDFLKPETFQWALQGCDRVFLMRPPAISNTKATLNVFVDEARRSGVKQIVFISVAGAGSNPVVPHHAVEQKLRHAPSGWTIIRPGFFMQNLEHAYLQDIKQDSRIYVPSGGARVAFVDVRDIAEIAVNALIDPATHDQKVYTITGPQALSFVEVAGLLSKALNRQITYQPAGILGYMQHLHRRGLPLAQVAVQTILHVGLRFGQSSNVTDLLQKLLGHKLHRMADYIQTNRDKWAK